MARPSKHNDLAARIRDSILGYPDGWEIPSIRDLARTYNVAPGTASKALQLLVQQEEIAGRGLSRRYVRSRTMDTPTFQAPYPAVAVLSYLWLGLTQAGYVSRLVGALLAGLSQSGVFATIAPNPKLPAVTVVPGGIMLGPPRQYFSAVAYVGGAPASVISSLVQAKVIVMSLDCASEVEGADSIVVDCELEAQKAVTYLASLGHREIGFLAPRNRVGASHWPDRVDPDAVRFNRAMLEAKQKAGINASAGYHQYYLMDVPPYGGAISLAVDRLWRLDPPPTAVVCFDAQAGPHVRDSLRARGLCCPGDVSILVRDCTSPEPPVFSMLASDPEQIGMAAAAQLCDRLSYPHSMPAKLQLVSKLLDGQTVGPAPESQASRRMCGA